MAQPNKSLTARFVRALRRNWELYLLFMPVAAWYLIFCYIPMGGVIIAFKNYQILQGVFASPWAGLSNFQRFISSSYFQSTLGNTIILSLMNLILVFPMPIIFALLLNEVRFTFGKRFVQTISYLPHFVSWMIAAGLFYMMLSPSTGPINNLIRFFGGSAVNFMGKSGDYRWIYTISSIWKGLGWGAIVYLAAITGVDEELYEAAAIDGVKRFRKVWNITLPAIRPVIIIMLIMQVGAILNTNMDQTVAMINPAVLSVGQTIEYYVFNVGLYSTNNFSLAAAVGVFKSVIAFVLVIGTNMISKRVSEGDGIW